MSVSIRIIVSVFLLLSLPLSAWGWDFSRHSIPVEDIISGGPPKDGIPALTNPRFVKAAKAAFLRKDEQVLGVYLNGIVRAYPIRLLSWHEIVNDSFGGLPVVVSW